MLEISRILLPVDFSERSCRAARYAIPFAARFQAEVDLLHVLPPHVEYGGIEMGTAVLEDLIVERHEHMEAAIRSFLETEFAGLRTKRVLIDGDPASRIVEYAHDENCDLILMPTHGHGPFRRLLLGSVTAKVLHDADCPVWTGLHMEEEPGHRPGVVERIVCALDLGKNSFKVLKWAAKMAAEFGACLRIVHAVNSLKPSTEPYGLSPEWRKYLLDQAQTEIAALQQAAQTSASVSIMIGNIADVVRAEAERVNADLLIIGRASRSGVLGRLTEHAYAIIRAAPCPAISV